jgi:hypothetical protein
MKKLNLILMRLMAIVLPLIFLCSCYEIVFISQENDKASNEVLMPDICIQVYNVNDKSVYPYLGILLHKSNSVKNGFFYTKDENNVSKIIGTFKYSKSLSLEMEALDPAPAHHYWWVGIGSSKVAQNGVYHAYPKIMVGKITGTFNLGYMLGDTENGLNILRSSDHPLTVVDEKTPSEMKANIDGKTIQLKWKAPKNSQNLMGFYLYQDGQMINEQLIQGNTFTVADVGYGSHIYNIVALYKNGNFGNKSLPAKICYSPCGNSMDFDGINDKLMVFNSTTLDVKKHITLEAWIKRMVDNQHETRIISKWEGNTGYELLLSTLKDSQSLEFRLPVGTLKSARPLATDRWYHVAAVYDGHEMQLFVNGKPDCSMLAHGYIQNTDYPLVLGKSSDENSSYFKGDIDDVRIWNIARTEAEILENFSSRIPEDEEGLVGYWTMSEGCSFTTCDKSASGNSAYLSGACFCAEVYPYVEDINNQTSSKLVVPVMNIQQATGLKPPNHIKLSFKINPKIMAFEGIVKENTQLAGYITKQVAHPDGTIRIEGVKSTGAPLTSDVLVYIDLKPLIGNFKSQLKFNECTIDGVSMRVSSGAIEYYAVPENFKSGKEELLQAENFFTAFPNPATTTLNVEIGELTAPADLRLVNISGQEVYRFMLQPNQSNTIHTIDLLGFSKGIYLINLQLNNKVHVKKIAVN